jgi:hypothetical protein
MRLIDTYISKDNDAQAQILRDYFTNTFCVEMFEGHFNQRGVQYPALQKKKRVLTLENARDLASTWIEGMEL